MKKLLLLILGTYMVTGTLTTANATNTQALVDATWLNAHIADSNLLILDVRKGKVYEKAHIPNAIYSDYAKWRISKKGLPGFIIEQNQLQELIRQLGIDEQSHVVVVSGINMNGDFGTAARVYWTLKVAGLSSLSVLDGGHASWIRAGYEVSPKINIPSPSTYTISEYDSSLLVTEAFVKTAVKEKTHRFLDARPLDFFKGFKKASAAKTGGTIKGSVNISQYNFIAGNGTLKPVETLQALVDEKIKKTEKVIAFCNTGHWAATDWFVLSEVLGYQTALYDGSMIEWTAHRRNPLDNKRSKKELKAYNKN